MIILAVCSRYFVKNSGIVYKMDNLTKRIVLFLIGCIGSRTLIAYTAKTIDINYLPYMGYLAIVIILDTLYIYITGSRTTGLEVFGGKIWWNDLRPIHALLYGLFAYSAINKQPTAWIYLMVDVVIGLVSFLVYHYTTDKFGFK